MISRSILTVGCSEIGITASLETYLELGRNGRILNIFLLHGVEGAVEELLKISLECIESLALKGKFYCVAHYHFPFVVD